MASSARTCLGRRLRLVVGGAVVITALTTATAGAGLPPANSGAATADAPQPRRPATTLAGFLYHQGRDGRGLYTPLREVPGAAITAHLGINNHGQITGAYVAGGGAASVHGFVRDRRGTMTTFEVPFGRLHSVSDINNRGQIVGYYDEPDLAGGGGFLRDRDGTIKPVTYPGALYTLVHGLNDRGQRVGAYLEPGAAPNSSFRPFRSPVPFLFVRQGVISDWKFFLDNEDWLSLWARRLGESAVHALAEDLRRLPWRVGRD